MLHVLDGDQRVALDVNQLRGLIESACAGLGADVKPVHRCETMRNLARRRAHGRGLQTSILLPPAR